MAAALKAERCEIIKVVDEHLLGRSAYRTGCKAIAASGTKRLPGIIGEAEAVEMILLRLTVTGPRAHEIGTVHEVVVDPLPRAEEIGAELSLSA
ncbi:hypothetical protein [Bradyrhizobium elkanii]|uniref:hypothetical protein n=1 Tax=Bradyrhizobium elkanii TaxID=29448 RepID=UPI002010F654|nr:hypothetical protein [Bradyrhizobium elkanii]